MFRETERVRVRDPPLHELKVVERLALDQLCRISALLHPVLEEGLLEDLVVVEAVVLGLVRGG